MTNGLGTTTYEYDALNRRVATTVALEHTTQVAYDLLGNVTDETDANGVVTHTVYDERNLPVAVIQNYRPAFQSDAETNVRIEYTYNAIGNRTGVKDANGHITEFHYDALNRVTEKIDPLGNTWQSTYDLDGRLTVQVDGNNQTTTYSYDAPGHLTGIDYPAPEADVSITYNAAGQQTEMTDWQLQVTEYTYDVLPENETGTGNAAGELPTGAARTLAINYTYDALRRLS
jgi:YD repeat-containing protein